MQRTPSEASSRAVVHYASLAAVEDKLAGPSPNTRRRGKARHGARRATYVPEARRLNLLKG